jgi:hypothetical protein
MPTAFTASFSGPDLVALTRALLKAAAYARGMPTEMRHKIAPTVPAPDWRERMLARDVNGLTISWGEGYTITRDPTAVTADFPTVPIDPRRVLDFVEGLPFELAVMPPVRTWIDAYFPPSGGGDHAFLGWGLVVRGAGHDNAIVSRRWLSHAPCRLIAGGRDTTLLLFHDLASPPPSDPNAIDHATLAQARPAHAWMLGGLLRPKHRYAEPVQGEYTRADGLVRVNVGKRNVSEREMLDACAARRDRRHHPEDPVKNVAFVFSDMAAARAHLDALWLRELECRVVVDGVETRLDERHSVTPARPAWTEQREPDQADERERGARVGAGAAAAAFVGDEAREALVVALDAGHAPGTASGALPAGLGADRLSTP